MWHRLPARSLVGASLAAGLPGLAVAGLGLAQGELAPGWAVLVAGASIAGPAALLRYLARRFERGVDSLTAAVLGGPAATARGPVETALAATGRRLARRHQGAVAEERAARAAAEALLETLPDPLLTLDRERRIDRLNAAGRALVGGDLRGEDLARGLRAPELLDAVARILAGGNAEVAEFSLTGPGAATYQARVSPVNGPSDGPAAVIVLADVTALKRAEQMRADFVANASHELRTPLSSLIGFLETLRGPAAEDPEAHRQFLPLMQQQAERMNRLVHDLLSLSRIELSEHSPPEEAVDLRAVLARAIDVLTPTATAAGMTLSLADHSRAATATVPGDSDQLEQVVNNLVENAIKYGHSGTEATVTLRDAPGAAGEPGFAIAVTDRGEGIPREHIPRLTERFYRVAVERSRARGGTGLGLAIVKHIVNRHRGGLTIDSAPGRGSTFTVTLPALTGEPSGNALAHSA